MAESKARNTDPRYSKLTIGVCPDQWGVWFPQDDKQIDWDVALKEMQTAGFSVMETGPFGYFPKDPTQLRDVMDEHGFTVVAGVYAVGPLSGAAFNPAVAAGIGILGTLGWRDVVGYWLVQLVAGAFAGHLFRYLHPRE